MCISIQAINLRRGYCSEDVRKGFDDTQLKVFTDNRQLLEELTQKNYENSVLLIMTSGNFSGIDIKELATQLIHK